MLKAERKDTLQELAAHLGINIGNFGLYDQALTHASTATEPGVLGRNYESLEFLGDAALGLAAAHLLYEKYPGKSPGEYTKMRAGLVSRRCLVRVAKKLNIAPAIRLGRGEEMAGGRQRAALLADCMESLIGAIYLDGGWDEVRDFVGRVFEDEFSRVVVSDGDWDYKSRLQDYCQGVRKPLPVFLVVRESGPDHAKEFEVEVTVEEGIVGRGLGSSKKEAEQLAAREALSRVEKLERTGQPGGLNPPTSKGETQ